MSALSPARRSPWLQQRPHLPAVELCTTGIIDRYRGKTSTFSKPANDLGAGRHALSDSLGPPVPLTSHCTSSRTDSLDQTSVSSCLTFAVSELPNELILSVLSYVSPDPMQTGRRERFRFPYYMRANDYHQQRVEFLLPLSMTCRAVRLRLLPWIWQRIEVFSLDRKRQEDRMRRPKTIMSALRTDPGLAMNVKYLHPFIRPGSGLICVPQRFLTIHLTYEFTGPLFVECLESLPNLHTLEVPWVDRRIANSLEVALNRTKLPQIKTLVISPATHSLLRHCHGVEDVVCAVRDTPIPTPSDTVFSSLTSNRNSIVKRLTIPLVSWANPSSK